jgi:hypothetical protein
MWLLIKTIKYRRQIMLSKENYDKLNENYLYKKEPIINNSYYIGQTPATYHCKNWTFKVVKYKDGRAYMRDTYFDDTYCEVTDENIKEFEIVFDFTEVKRISNYEKDEYKEEDLFRVATDSGGYSCGKLYWVKKDTQKCKDLIVNKQKEEVESLKRQLKWSEDTLERMLNGDWKFS